jgi:hypothetical protein
MKGVLTVRAKLGALLRKKLFWVSAVAIYFVGVIAAGHIAERNLQKMIHSSPVPECLKKKGGYHKAPPGFHYFGPNLFLWEHYAHTGFDKDLLSDPECFVQELRRFESYEGKAVIDIYDHEDKDLRIIFTIVKHPQ